MELQVRALALEELALHSFPGISFERLCAILQEEHQIHFDPFVKAVLWRSLYRSPDAVFTHSSTCGIDTSAPDPTHANSAVEGPQPGQGVKLRWRDPSIPPDLSVSPRLPTSERSLPETEEARTNEGEEAKTGCFSEQERCWLLSTSAGVPLRLLMPMDFGSDPVDFERRVAEMPFRVLRNIARHKEHGQWQYRIAQELSLDPKSVFHHLKPLYRDELICHMQLAIPPGHKTLDRSSSRGPITQLLVREDGFSNLRSASRTNLTMSALLWSSRFFSPLRLPAAVRGLMTLHHLLPLQQQAVDLLQKAPNHILLEEEVRHFCTSKLLSSDQAPYLRFSDKQVRRFFHRLREALERTGKVRRVRAFCKQTVRYERCLLYTHSDESNPKKDQVQAGGSKSENDPAGAMIAQVKVEEGTLAATAASAALRDGTSSSSSGGAQTSADVGDDVEEGSSVVLEVEGASLASLASFLLKAAGSDGVTTVELALLLGLDSKRSGKLLAEFHRRNLVSRVAERRGKCFLYRYISKELPNLQELLANAPGTSESPDPAEPGSGEALSNDTSSCLLTEPILPVTGASLVDECVPASDRGQDAILDRYEAQAETTTPSPLTSVIATPADADGLPRAKQEPEDETPPIPSRPAGRRPAQPLSRAVAGNAGTRKRPARTSAQRSNVKKRACSTRQAQPRENPAEEAQPVVDTAADATTAGSAPPPPTVSPDPADDASGNADCEKEGTTQSVGSKPQGGLSRHLEAAKAQAETRGLPARTLRLLDTPQFVARLTLFQETIRSAGCSTIPNISKAIADMEQTANGPDRKTVQRMADVAMQLEPRILRGRLAPSKASADRIEEAAATPAVSGEITFFYWSETHDEASAEQRIAALITQRRAQGCRDAIRRNQLLLDGKLKEAGEELGLSATGAPAAATPPQPPEHTSGQGSVSEGVNEATRLTDEARSGTRGTGCVKSALEDQQLRGLESEISRLANLESRSTSTSVMQPCPGTTAASLLMVEKTIPLASLHDKVPFSQKHLSFYGFIFPVMVRAKCFHQYLLSLTLQLQTVSPSSTGAPDGRRLAVSTMIRRMPLESFLRLVGCGYALPMLDEHLSKDSASRQPMHKLPGPLFRLLVFSSRQIQCYRQLHPKAKIPLLGLGKKNAGTAVRKLLSLLGRMGIVSRNENASPAAEESPSQRSSPTPATWKLNEVLKLPAFSTTGTPAGGVASETKEFDGLSHEGVEAFWQQLQLQVSQWMMQEQQITWALDGGAEPSQFFSPHSDASDVPNASDREAPEGYKAADTPGTPTRRRPQPPKGFDVPEAFNSKNWKGQVAFTSSARAAMDAFAAETLENLRDAGGAELEAVVLNASSPQIAELSARVGYPTDAVLRYLIRVFEIKGGPERNHALLVGGSPWDDDEGAGPPITLMQPNQTTSGDAEVARNNTANSSVDREATQHELRVAKPKGETKERDRGIGLIVHRTREVRFQCHHCGHFYSWEKSIRLHYDKASAHFCVCIDRPVREAAGERAAAVCDGVHLCFCHVAYRRQEDRQQKAELSKFKRRRRTIIPSRDHVGADTSQQPSHVERELLKASERFASRLPTRGTVKSVEAPATGFLLRAVAQQLLIAEHKGLIRDATGVVDEFTVNGSQATHDEEAVLASMSREDEITLIGAAIVAERLWLSSHSAARHHRAPSGVLETLESRNGPLTDAWLSPGTPQSLPPEDHSLWQILGRLCRPPLAPARARLYVGFVLSRRALNSRIFSSFRRLEPSALRHFVLEGRIPSALEIRVHCFPREEGAGPRKPLVCRPLNNPRILMARNILKAVVFTPLPFYRPAVLFTALRELRPLELNALWRAWQRRGWVTAFKPTSATPAREKKEPASAEPSARHPQPYKRPEIATALEIKCRRPFVLSSGSRLSLFGRLRDYRSLSALLDATIGLTARTAAHKKTLNTGATTERDTSSECAVKQVILKVTNPPCVVNDHNPAPEVADDHLFSHLPQEGQESQAVGEVEGELTNDADLQLLQLLENDRQDPTCFGGLSPSAGPVEPSHPDESIFLSKHCSLGPVCKLEDSVSVVGRIRLPVDSKVSGYEVLAALEGLGRGKLWLLPFWGTDGRLPDSPEAADDAELLNLLEEEDSLDQRAAAGGIWNDVPEWLSAISRGEEGGDILPGRPMRKPTEGGIETHITAHAAGVSEITAVTCAVLRGYTGFHSEYKYQEAQPASDADPHAPSRDPGDFGDFPCAEVGSICNELGAAFECCQAVPPAGFHPMKAAKQTPSGVGRPRCVLVAAASHLPDGLFGAAGEFDAFDASLLPPLLTDRTSSAAISFLNREGTDCSFERAEKSGAPMVLPGLHGGFPVSLPTYADDHKQHWRLAARAAEAFAPPGCSCNAACGCTTECKPTADTAVPCLAAAARDDDPPCSACSPVAPLPAFARATGKLADLANNQGNSVDLIRTLGPIEILVRCLKATHAHESSSSTRKKVHCSDENSKLPEDFGHVPYHLLEAVEETARVALRVQISSLLPLLPTPPSPLAAAALHEETVKELTSARLRTTSAVGVASRETLNTGETEERERSFALDLTVCTALTICTAWILAAVLKGKAEGVAVPDLLKELSTGEGNMAQEATRTDLRGSARLSFAYAARKLSCVGGDQQSSRTPVSSASCDSCGVRRNPDFTEAQTIRNHNRCSSAASACQLFLVSTSVLCWARLVLPVPAGGSWRLVSAAEAAFRFCLKQQRILRDSVAIRWDSHARHYETETERIGQRVAANLCSQNTCDGGGKLEELEEVNRKSDRSTEESPPRPAMVPRAIWAMWGPPASYRKSHLSLQEAQPNCALTPATDSSLGHRWQEEVTASLIEPNDEACRDGDLQAVNVCRFLSALLTWEEARESSAPPPVGTSDREEASSVEQPSTRPAGGSRIHLPMKLSPDILPACAWLRLDGRLHASLVQLICLRLWGLLMQRPGSTAQQLQGMLCLLDDCEVQLLLHALAEEGIVTAAVLSEPPAALCQRRDDFTSTQDCLCLDGSLGASNGEFAEGCKATHHGFSEEHCLADGESGGVNAAGTKAHTPFHALPPGLSVIHYALRVQTIYLPNAVADVLPKFQPLLLPKLATCSCGCSAFL